MAGLNGMAATVSVHFFASRLSVSEITGELASHETWAAIISGPAGVLVLTWLNLNCFLDGSEPTVPAH